MIFIWQNAFSYIIFIPNNAEFFSWHTHTHTHTVTSGNLVRPWIWAQIWVSFNERQAISRERQSLVQLVSIVFPGISKIRLKPAPSFLGDTGSWFWIKNCPSPRKKMPTSWIVLLRERLRLVHATIFTHNSGKKGWIHAFSKVNANCYII